jgi:hypothetical protein
VLEDVGGTIAELMRGVKALEQCTVDAISLEELLGHCHEVYQSNRQGAAALERHLQQYGYSAEPAPEVEPGDAFSALAPGCAGDGHASGAGAARRRLLLPHARARISHACRLPPPSPHRPCPRRPCPPPPAGAEDSQDLQDLQGLDQEALRLAAMLESSLAGALLPGTPTTTSRRSPVSTRRARPTTLSAPSSPVSAAACLPACALGAAWPPARLPCQPAGQGPDAAAGAAHRRGLRHRAPQRGGELLQDVSEELLRTNAAQSALRTTAARPATARPATAAKGAPPATPRAPPAPAPPRWPGARPVAPESCQRPAPPAAPPAHRRPPAPCSCSGASARQPGHCRQERRAGGGGGARLPGQPRLLHAGRADAVALPGGAAAQVRQLVVCRRVGRGARQGAHHGALLRQATQPPCSSTGPPPPHPPCGPPHACCGLAPAPTLVPLWSLQGHRHELLVRCVPGRWAVRWPTSPGPPPPPQACRRCLPPPLWARARPGAS